MRYLFWIAWQDVFTGSIRTASYIWNACDGLSASEIASLEWRKTLT